LLIASLDVLSAPLSNLDMYRVLLGALSNFIGLHEINLGF